MTTDLTLPDGETDATVTYRATYSRPEREHGFVNPYSGGWEIEIERVMVGGDPVVLTEREYLRLTEQIAESMEAGRE